MKILITGGCGYIGSHTAVELISRGHDVLIVDNLENSSPRVLDHIYRITSISPKFIETDIRDGSSIKSILHNFRPDGIIHFAALKSVSESWRQPIMYFDYNICGTISLLDAMLECGVQHLVFSSSATVYGSPDNNPITEDDVLRVTNPYGRSKLVTEGLIEDVCTANTEFHAAILRYFNPVGAHPSAELGEDPTGEPANLMPYICQVAVGRLPHLNVYGNDYPTPDGTGVRDYIHIMDLARAHADALHTLINNKSNFTINIGTGQGYSVLELIKMFEKVSGRTIPYHICPRRLGDAASCYAAPDLAKQLIDWRAELGLERMCEDSWRWQSRYPNGYRSH